MVMENGRCHFRLVASPAMLLPPIAALVGAMTREYFDAAEAIKIRSRLRRHAT